MLTPPPRTYLLQRLVKVISKERAHKESVFTVTECTQSMLNTRSYILLIHTLNACRACHCILRVCSRHTQREYSGILELYSECTLVYSEFPKHFLKGFWVYIGTLHQSILRVYSEYALSKLRHTVRML